MSEPEPPSLANGAGATAIRGLASRARARRWRRPSVVLPVALALVGGALWAGASLSGGGTPGVIANTGGASCPDPKITVVTATAVRATTLPAGMQQMPGATPRSVSYGTSAGPAEPRVEVSLGPPGPLVPPALPPGFATRPVSVTGQPAVAAEPAGSCSLNVY